MNDAYIKNKQVFSFLPIFLIGFFFLFYTGCSNPTSGTYDNNGTLSVVRGLIQKGKFLDGEIKAQSISSKGERVGEVITSTINANGEYNLNLKLNGLYLFTAKGKFFNEYTGKNSSEEVELYALVDVGAENFSKKINLNLFTSLEYSRVIELMKKGKSYKDALSETRDSMKTLFGVDKGVNTFNLDIYDMNGTLKKENKNLLLFSATLLKVINKSNFTKDSKKSLKGISSPLFSITPSLAGTISKFLKNYGTKSDEFNSMLRGMAEDNEANTWGTATANLGFGELEAPYEDWLNDSVISTPLELTEFSLKSVILNNIERDYARSDTRVYIGSANDNPKLKVFLRSTYSVAKWISYRVNIYAESEGLPSLLLIENEEINSPSLVKKSRTQSKNINIPFNALFKSYVNRAYSNNKTVKLKVVASIVENGVTKTKTKFLDSLPRFRELYKNAMSPRTHIEHSLYLGKCEGLDSHEYVRMNITGKYRNSANITYNDVCVNIDYEPAYKKYVAILARGTAILAEPYTRTFGGMDIDVYVSSIDNEKEEIEKILLKLPPQHSIHSSDNDGNILPRGENSIVLDNPDNNIIKHATNSLNFSGSLAHKYLHIKNLPFYFELNNYSVGSEAWKFSNTKVKYLFDYANMKINNSERFKEPLNQSITLNLVNEGVTPDKKLKFLSTNIETHYPKLSEISTAFEVAMINSQLMLPITSSSDSFLKMKYSPECHAIGCSDSNALKELELSNIVSTKLYSDGASLSTQTSAIGEVTWGSKDSNSVFKRANDEGAKVYIPGFELPTNKVEEVSSYLLGTIEDKDEALPVYHKVGESVTQKGEHIFAGVNVGDFVSRDLDGKNMTLLLGDNQTLTLTSHGYSKYFLRPSGLTGVFNNKGAIPQLNIYSYKMNFDQFKFRQTNNVLDDYSKIDGSVHVPNKGMFDVAFKSLALDCRGNFNKGIVSEEQETSKLFAWEMATTFTTIGFDNRDNDVCSSNKELVVGHTLKVAALKDKLGANIWWTPLGIPVKSTIISASSNQLDGNRSKDDEFNNGGYDVELGSMKLASSSEKDWFESNVSFGLPFWGATGMSVRLVNKSLTTREPSVVVHEGNLSVFNMNSSNNDIVTKISKDYRQPVSTKWANVLPFSLPVYYDSKIDGEHTPQFLGRTLGQDLVLMKADAGVDYITPDKTSMSFGASANFAKLKGLKLHIDLNDPNSIKEIDASLDKYLHLGTPLWDSVGQLVSAVNIGDTLLKNGLTMSMEEGAFLALNKASKELREKDPFEYLAKNNAKVYAMPSVMHEKFERILSFEIDALLNKINEENIAQVQQEIDRKLREYDTLVSYLNTTKDTLATMKSIENLVESGVRELSIPGLQSFIQEGAFGGGTCSWDNFSTQGFFKPVGTVTNTIGDIDESLRKIKIKKITEFAEKANEFTGLNSKDLVSLAKKVRNMSHDLSGLVNGQQSWVHQQFESDGAICGSIDRINTALKNSYKTLGFDETFRTNLEQNIETILKTLQDQEVIKLRERLAHLADEDIDSLRRDLSLTITTPILSKTNEMVSEVQSKIPNLSAEDMRHIVVTKIFATAPVRKLIVGMNKKMEPVANELNKLSSVLFFGLDKSINKTLSKVNAKVNALLAKATSKLDKIPLGTASMDGYATFYGDSLHRLHIGSEFKISGKDKDSSFSFNAALDIENEDSNGSFGCGGTKNKSNLHAAISTRDVTMPIGSKKLKVDLILLGVTISPSGKPRGIFGAIASKGGFKMDKFELYNMALEVGIGMDETYLGARANAKLDDLQLGMSYLVGIVCNPKVRKRLLPKAILDFITIPNGKFNGAMIFGEAQVPVWVNGCALTVNAKAKLGLWFLFGPPKTFGGLVGGGAYGKALCIATLGGEIEILAEKSGDVVQFQGSGWGAAGVGSCDNSWSSVSDSRSDSWCGTGDAQFGAKYKNGWTLLDIETSAVH